MKSKILSRRILLTSLALLVAASTAYAAVCSVCGGSGTGPFKCSFCNGSGFSGSFKCSFCNGRGIVKCSSCNGTGQR